MKNKLFFSFFIFSLILFSSLSIIPFISADVEVIHVIPNFVFTLEQSNVQKCINVYDYFSGFDVVLVYIDEPTCPTCLESDYISMTVDTGDYFKQYASVSGKFQATLQHKSATNWELCIISAYTNNFALYPLVIAGYNTSTSTEQDQFVSVIASSRVGGDTDPNFYLPRILNTFHDIINLRYDGVFYQDLDNVFINYDKIDLLLYDSQNNFLTQFDGTPFFISSDNPSGWHRQQFLSVCQAEGLSPYFCMESNIINSGTPEATPDASMFLRIKSTQKDFYGTLKVIASNEYGSSFIFINIASNNNTEDLVPVGDPLYSNATSFLNNYIDEVSEIKKTYSPIGFTSNILSSFFPDKESLTLAEKFAYTLITFLLVDILIIVLFIKVGNPNFLGITILILDVLMFFYFLAIGYIPIGILIIFILFALLISFFKIKSGG